MAVSSRDPREHWLKTHFLKNEVANSGCVGRSKEINDSKSIISRIE